MIYMTTIFLLLFQISFSTSLASNWFSCSLNTDCIKTSAICGSKTSINKKFKVEHTAYVWEASKTTNCLEPNQQQVLKDKKRKPYCNKSKSKCELKTP